MTDDAWNVTDLNGGCVQGVAQGTLTVGDAVLFIALVQQLSAPLNYFGSFYRQIQTYMCGPPSLSLPKLHGMHDLSVHSCALYGRPADHAEKSKGSAQLGSSSQVTVT